MLWFFGRGTTRRDKRSDALVEPSVLTVAAPPVGGAAYTLIFSKLFPFSKNGLPNLCIPA